MLSASLNKTFLSLSLTNTDNQHRVASFSLIDHPFFCIYLVNLNQQTRPFVTWSTSWVVISLISVHTSSFGSILVLNLYGGTKKYIERWSFSRDRSSSDRSSSDQSSSDQSSSDQSCLLLVRIPVQPGL